MSNMLKKLGFRKFNGEVAVRDILSEIGADYQISTERLVRVTDEQLMQIQAGLPILIPQQKLIATHKATYSVESGSTAGVVGINYQPIQNEKGLEIIDLLTNKKVSGIEAKVVSAGLVSEFRPYIQVEMPFDPLMRVDGDNSDRRTYLFFTTSHDGTSSLKVSFTDVRVVCQNTFMYNYRNKVGFSLKHTSGSESRLDFSDPNNIKGIRGLLESHKVFQVEYLEKLNHLAHMAVSEREIDKFIINAFLDTDIWDTAKEYGYNLNRLLGATDKNGKKVVSTRSANKIDIFRDTLESGVGQDANRGTRLWLLNATTNYFSNTASYGSRTASEKSNAIKEFASRTEGVAYNKTNQALDYLMADQLVAV